MSYDTRKIETYLDLMRFHVLTTNVKPRVVFPFRYAAADSDGLVHVFASRPECIGGMWINSSGRLCIHSLKPRNYWKDTLIEL